MRFTSEGHVENGLIECGYWDGDTFNPMEVVDLFKWLKSQFAFLRDQHNNIPETLGRKPSATRTIWLGSDEVPFGSLHVNKSKFKIYFYHPEIIGIFESTDIDEISSVIVGKVSKISRFNWTGMTPKFAPIEN